MSGWVCVGGGWGLLHGKAKGKEANPSLYSSCEPGFLFLSFLCNGACADSMLMLCKDTRLGAVARYQGAIVITFMFALVL